VAARLGTKSTLEETRTERFIGIAKRGSLPVPLSYYAAHTGRWGGTDKLNLQNLPSRGNNTLKSAILAPPGHVIIDCDSSQIEARVLAWLSGQDDLVEAFANKQDVYKIMASKIYRKPVEEISKEERFMGKTVVLGCGYGLGAAKFQSSLKSSGVTLELEECKQIITTYRESYPAIPALWKQGQKCLEAMLVYQTAPIGVRLDALYLGQHGFVLPSGYRLGYADLQKDAEGQFSYKARNGRTKIYGGKVIENVVQALARCVIAEQMVKISERYRPVLTVHDAIAIVAPVAEAERAQAFVEGCFNTTPEWAEGLPLACESGIGDNYGQC
jgi:DNA polymerase